MNGLVVLVPYDCGQEFYTVGESNETYLPVYVETDDENLALMAVAYAACVHYCYVACPEVSRTAQEWEERSYPGTLKSPKVKLPRTQPAFTIPEPGDCFCCGSLEDYLVSSKEGFRNSLKISSVGYFMGMMKDDEDLWQEFNDWCILILGYQLLNVGIEEKYSKLTSSQNSIDENEESWHD